MREIGLNLFTLHKFIQTEEGLLSTVEALKKMGYTYMQYSGAPFDAERIMRVSKATGIPFVLTHVPIDRIINDTDRLMQEHEMFGCKNIGLGAIKYEVMADENVCFPLLDKLNLAAEKMANNGFTFFHHNHYQEFIKHNGVSPYEYMINNCPYIHFTLDTYWIQYSGINNLEIIPRLSGRVECVHLKDYSVAVERGDEISIAPKIAAVGDGNLNFPAIVASAKAAGTKYFFVEQDNACTKEDPMAEVERSINYIKENL